MDEVIYNKVSPCIDEYKPNKYKKERTFTETRKRAEKKHLEPINQNSDEIR